MLQKNLRRIPELIKHCDQSIVHRSILRSRYGSITLFAIGDNESISEHKSTSDEFIYVVDGIIELILDNKNIVLRKGHSQHILPNTLHTVNGIDSGIFLLVIIRNFN